MHEPLERRDNPTSWVALLDAALPAIDLVYSSHPNATWTLGGGTALALRIAHRLSHDIDIFVPGIPLREFAPFNNPAARTIASKFEWPGHYLKFTRDDGEIDFLSPSVQTTSGFTLEAFRDRAIALETPQEVIAKKLRFRSASFSVRDAFDLAAVARADPNALVIATIETADALRRVRDVLARHIDRGVDPTALIKPRPAFAPLVPTCLNVALAETEKAITRENGPFASLNIRERQLVTLAATAVKTGTASFDQVTLLFPANPSLSLAGARDALREASETGGVSEFLKTVAATTPELRPTDARQFIDAARAAGLTAVETILGAAVANSVAHDRE
jgi:hypothetical protein